MLRDAIAAGDLTWRSRIDGRIAYRWWFSEREYRLLTRAERRRLEEWIAAGYVDRYVGGGFTSGRGGLELTNRGRNV